MDSGSLAVLGAALIAALAAAYATRVTRRATQEVETRQDKLDEAKVDGAAYEIARSQYQQILETLRLELTRTQEARVKEATEFQRRISDLEAAGRTMRADIRILKATMETARIPIPQVSTD